MRVSSPGGRGTALALLVIPALVLNPVAAPGQTSRPARTATTDKPAAAQKTEATDATPRPAPFDYTAYDALLGKYVKGGLVDYAAWKKDGTKELDKVLEAMAGYPYQRVLSREARLAFLINAYNAAVMRSVLEAYPVASVKEIPGFFDRKEYPLSGGSYTLDAIEKDLIRANFTEFPTFHFALVCGARGCPPLAPRAVTGDSLSARMAAGLRAFVADSTKVRLSQADYVLHVSELFKWYAADFEKGDQTVPRLLAPHFSLGIAMKMAREEPRLEYVPFDWALNEWKAPGGGR